MNISYCQIDYYSCTVYYQARTYFYEKMKLIWGSGSSPCMKVIMVLAEKGKWDSCESQLISFSKKEHKTEEMFKINPRGQVPTFIDDDGLVLCESVATCMYLEDKYKKEGTTLIPADPKDLAAVYQRMFECPNITSNIIVPYLYYMFRTKPEDIDKAVLEEKAPGVHTELQRWDGYLKDKKFLAGDNFTMADIFFYPDLAMLVRQGVDLGQYYPNLKKYYDGLQSRPSVIACAPPHWKDEPSKFLMKDFKPPAEQESAK